MTLILIFVNLLVSYWLYYLQKTKLKHPLKKRLVLGIGCGHFATALFMILFYMHF